MNSETKKVADFFSHPYMVAIAWGSTVVALPLAIYLYVAADHKPLLTYKVQSVNTSVVRAGQSSQLSVSFNGQPLSGDVSSAQLAVWNAGKQAIHGALKPLRIFTEPKCRILEARVRSVSRDVVGLKIDESEYAKGNVIVRWDLLEENDGGVVQIIFAGKPDATVFASAVIEGQQTIRRADRKTDPWVGKALLAVAFLFSLLMGVVLAIYLSEKVAERLPPRLRGNAIVATLITFSFIPLLILVLAAIFGDPTPPFNF